MNAHTAAETAADFEDAVPEVDDDPEDLPLPQDIVACDLETLERRVLVTSKQLTPVGADAPLTLDGFSWSEDRRRLPIYTNSERVWRVNSRGDYWLLDVDTGELRQLLGCR